MTDLRTLIAHYREIVRLAERGVSSGHVTLSAKIRDAAASNLFAALLDVAEAVEVVEYDFFEPIGKALDRLREAMEANRG